jgi:hypothetical protein
MTMINKFTMKMVHIIEDITDSKILHSCRWIDYDSKCYNQWMTGQPIFHSG